MKKKTPLPSLQILAPYNGNTDSYHKTKINTYYKIIVDSTLKQNLISYIF